MLKKLIVSENFTRAKVSDPVKALFLCVDNLPLTGPIRVNILMLNLDRSLNFDTAPFDDIKSGGLISLIVNNIIGVKSLLLKELVELSHPVV